MDMKPRNGKQEEKKKIYETNERTNRNETGKND